MPSSEDRGGFGGGVRKRIPVFRGVSWFQGVGRRFILHDVGLLVEKNCVGLLIHREKQNGLFGGPRGSVSHVLMFLRGGHEL